MIWFFSLFSLLFFWSPLRWDLRPFYSYLNCILAFNLKGCWFLFGYLSHHCFASSGRVSYRLVRTLFRGYYAINVANWVVEGHLMWRWWILYLESSPVFIYLLPWSSSASNLIAFVAFFMSHEKYLFPGLLWGIAILGFDVLIALGLLWWTIRANYISGRSW